MPSLSRYTLGLLTSALLATPALGDEAPACKTYDRTPVCCAHPPPACCAPELRQIDERVVTEVCGASPYKGEAGIANECKRYFDRGSLVAEVAYGREKGGEPAFAKLRATLGGPRAKVTAQSFAGARQGFMLRELDENGKPSRTAAWALTDTEIVHVEVEAPICDDKQVMKLLERVLAKPAGPRG